MKETIKALLTREDKMGQIAVTTALVRLYQRQTADEQASGTTSHHNGMGFSAFDAGNGTYMARYALGSTTRNPNGGIDPTQWDTELLKLESGQATPIRLIDGRFLPKARKLVLRYVGQLAEIAQAKQSSQAA